jgi:hypothetical protein
MRSTLRGKMPRANSDDSGRGHSHQQSWHLDTVRQPERFHDPLILLIVASTVKAVQILNNLVSETRTERYSARGDPSLGQGQDIQRHPENGQVGGEERLDEPLQR